jgi:hypothetical protein
MAEPLLVLSRKFLPVVSLLWLLITRYLTDNYGYLPCDYLSNLMAVCRPLLILRPIRLKVDDNMSQIGKASA